MTRLMRDSTTPIDIPHDTQLVAGYYNGMYMWSTVEWLPFPKERRVTIDVAGNSVMADVLDIEKGAATVWNAEAWVRDKLSLRQSYPPVLYVNRNNMADVIKALKGYKLGFHYKLWVSTLDGTTTLPDMTGVIAVQFSGASKGSHYDASVVYDDNWKPVKGNTVAQQLNTEDLNAIAKVVQENRDFAAGAVLYALRYLDPSVALPDASNPGASALLANSATELRKLFNTFLTVHENMMNEIVSNAVTSIVDQVKGALAADAVSAAGKAPAAAPVPAVVVPDVATTTVTPAFMNTSLPVVDDTSTTSTVPASTGNAVVVVSE